MSIKHFLLLVFIQVWIDENSCFLLDNSDAHCPFNCSCMHGAFLCTNKSLLDVPPIPNSRYCKIYLNNNMITAILPGAFKNQSTCSSCQIVLNNNYIHTFSDGAFNGIMNCTLDLYLNHNSLTSIPTAFQVLKRLNKLSMNGNPLKQLDSAVMVNIGHSLRTFDYDMGSFDSWPHQLQYLRALEHLTIGYIAFTNIPNNAFHGLEHRLFTLEIHDSELVKIPQAICTLQALRYLNFSSNQNLDEINSLVTEQCLANRLKLYSLIFDDNGVETFPSFYDMFHETSDLTARNNGFTVMIGDLFISKNFTVNRLNLDNNNFSRIPYAVNLLPSLQELYIAHNFVIGIDESDIFNLVNLEILDLKGNPLVYISHKSFENNLNLRQLDISGTKLRQIPSAVLYLTHLYSLTLDQDPIECTCDLSYLKSWNNTSIISDNSLCLLSNEKIQNYLTQFLPYC